MTEDLRFERSARAWLELGPVEAPDAVVQAALLEIDTTSQERDLRVPWRIQTMPTFARALLVAAVLVGLVAGGAFVIGGGRPPAQPELSPSPSPTAAPSQTGLAATDLSGTFTSDRYGYTLPVDPLWTTRQASLTWTGPDNSYPVVDELEPIGGNVVFNAASEALADGQTLDAWLDLFQSPQNEASTCFGGAPATWPTRQIGGRSWTIQQGCGGKWAITEQDGRVYVLTCAGCGSETPNPAASALFDRLLADVELHPELALAVPPAPALDAAFTSRQHGFTVAYPAAWAVLQQASESAPPDRMPVPQNPSLDAIGNADQRLSVTSRELDEGQSPTAWVQAFCAITRTDWSPACDQDPAAWERVPLANGDAWILVNGDTAATFPVGDSREFIATAVSGGRAYEIRLEGNVERSLFDAILASITLDPASAKP
jgi:hypothetical protein